jgi:hypothetical protein
MNLDHALAYLKTNPSKRMVNLHFDGLHHVIMTTLEFPGAADDAEVDPEDVFVDITTSALFEDTDFAADTDWGTISDQTGYSLEDIRDEIADLKFLCADDVPGIFDKELTEYMLHDVFSALPHPDEISGHQQMTDFALKAMPLVNDLFSNKTPEIDYQVMAVVMNPTETVSPLNLRSWLRSSLNNYKSQYKPGVVYIGFLFLTKAYIAALGKQKLDKILSSTIGRNAWIQARIVYVDHSIDSPSAHRYVNDQLAHHSG